MATPKPMAAPIQRVFDFQILGFGLAFGFSPGMESTTSHFGSSSAIEPKPLLVFVLVKIVYQRSGRLASHSCLSILAYFP